MLVRGPVLSVVAAPHGQGECIGTYSALQMRRRSLVVSGFTWCTLHMSGFTWCMLHMSDARFTCRVLALRDDESGTRVRST